MKQTKSTAGTNGKSGAADKASPKMQKTSDEQGLKELHEDFLKDIYWAEKALTKALPKMITAASSPELISSLEEHLSVTKEQVSRLEEVFEVLGKTPRGKKCEAMEGLIKEGESIVEDFDEGMVRDAGIIGAAQKIEHYEIATYGTLASFARILGETAAEDLYNQTLEEEKQADAALSDVALSGINKAAASEA
jgi:ferritin-like metal-binding protein YciE